ncbi:MAG: dihydroxy-acid dehydratase, partial [Opitutae bacterium]|nr:dihydroxy-acid dehydratase [Opitutae bacterium]
ALVRDGDTINIDIEHNRLDVKLTDDELDDRRKDFKPKESQYKTGVLAKYAKLVSSASNGAVTD